MRLFALLILLPLTSSCTRSATLQPTPEPSAINSGKRAQFLYGSRGWFDGYVIRRNPGTAQECLAVFAAALNGAVMLAEIDSLRLDRHPGIGVGGLLPAATETLPRPSWQSVSVAQLQSREPQKCASYVKRASDPAA